jgi:peptide/nickel transport system substrate-binding protein
LKLPFVFLALVLASCSNPSTSPRDTVTTAISAPVQSLNPLYTTDAASQHLNELLHASLVSISDQLVPEPYLAEEFHYVSPTSVEFRLKAGCRFADGSELKSRDVERSLRFMQDEKNGSAFSTTFQRVTKFETIDERRFRLHTARPDPSLLTDLVLLKILDFSAIPAEEKPSHIPGLGPYRLKSLSPSLIALERSGQPCLPTPPAAKIRVKTVRDDLSRFLKLRTGELDIVMNEMNFRKVEAIEKDKSLPMRVLSQPGISYNYLGVNLSSGKLRDSRVREAIALSFDIPALIRYKSRSMAIPARNLLADQNYFANLNVPVVKRDLGRARKLLDEAGFGNGSNGKPPLRLTLKTTTSLISIENARVLAAQAKEAGIELEHQAYEWGIFYNDVKSGNAELYLLRWVGVTDPRVYFEVFHSGEIGRNNRTRYQNAALDKLLEAGEAELDRAKRKDIYARVQEIAARDLPFIGLWYVNNVAVYRKELRNVRLHPTGSWTVFLEMSKE